MHFLLGRGRRKNQFFTPKTWWSNRGQQVQPHILTHTHMSSSATALIVVYFGEVPGQTVSGGAVYDGLTSCRCCCCRWPRCVTPVCTQLCVSYEPVRLLMSYTACRRGQPRQEAEHYYGTTVPWTDLCILWLCFDFVASGHELPPPSPLSMCCSFSSWLLLLLLFLQIEVS